MGWVGVVTLLATACYLLYRYPPAAWNQESFIPPPQRPESTSGATPTTPSSEDVNTPDDASEASKDASGDTGDLQSTPKASATNAPALDVPTLQLASDDDQADKATGTQKQNDRQQTTNNSAQPLSASKPITSNGIKSIPMPPPQSTAASTSSLMPPPPPPRLRPSTQQNQQAQSSSSSSSSLSPGRFPPRPSAGSSLSPPPSAAASLRVPPGSRPASNNTLAPISLTLKPSKAAKKAVLEPGFSPLDWAALTANPNNNLRGANLPPSLIRVTPSMLKAQNGRKGRDAWTSYQGKVYNITRYLPFHPGGKGELLRGAGKDSAKLFMEIHPWVNWDAILGECLVGILVSENEVSTDESHLDAMD